MMPSAWVEDSTIDEFCAPLTQNAAKVRFLRDELGLVVTRRRNGRPAVAAEAWEAMQRGVKQAEGAGQELPTPTGPNRAGLVLQFKQRR
jgi:hypothetical protein